MWLILAVLTLPLIEIALFVVVGGAIGLWATLAWVILTAILGVLVLKWVARLGPISFERDVRALRNPRSPIAHRALTILAGTLLVLPGFFTDSIGLLLLLTPVQTGIIAFLSRNLDRGVVSGAASVTVEGEWSEVSSPTDDRVASGQQPPSGQPRH